MVDFVKNGTNFHFELDVDKIVRKETENPDFNFFQTLSDVGDNFKLSTIVMLCEFIGSDFKTLASNKFSISEISKIIKDCIEEMGFFSEE